MDKIIVYLDDAAYAPATTRADDRRGGPRRERAHPLGAGGLHAAG